MALVQFLSGIGCIVMNNISFTVLIKKQRGINASKVQTFGITPTLKRILGFYHHITDTTGKLSSNQIKSIVVLVVFNRWGINSGRNTRVKNLKLRLSIQDVSYLLPIHKVI